MNADVLTFMIDGSYEPATKKYDGDLRPNINACPPDRWHATIE